MVVHCVAYCFSLYVAGCFMFLARHVLGPGPIALIRLRSIRYYLTQPLSLGEC